MTGHPIRKGHQGSHAARLRAQEDRELIRCLEQEDPAEAERLKAVAKRRRRSRYNRTRKARKAAQEVARLKRRQQALKPVQNDINNKELDP